MRAMNPRPPLEIQDAVEHLPVGATLVIPDVSWDDYEKLLDAVAERNGLRISYDCGRLEIVSPLQEHGAYERLVEDLITAYCETFRLNLEKFGSATWKKRSLRKGLEPDACYYIANARHIVGKRRIDLETDLPPDIAVEIDLTNNSLQKFPIYAALGIPEIWRYDSHDFHFYRLTKDRYREVSSSRFLRRLTPQMLGNAIEISKISGRSKARSMFRLEIGRIARKQ